VLKKMNSYLTAALPGIGGVFKEVHDDFIVHEIPLYLPSGQGEHCYVEIEKRGITTLEAIRRVARALEVAERDIGYAGMKDARGISRQTISIPRVRPEQVLALEIPALRILSARMHGNKLRLGHLAGNRFSILIREVAQDAKERADAIIRVLCQRGLPNWFGEQRYGIQGNSALIGRAILRQDFREAIAALIGKPELVTDERWQEGIAAFRRGEIEESLRLLPSHCRTERDVLQRLLRKPDNHAAAFRAVNPRLQKLFLSACQSALFDQVLAERLESFDRVLEGDLAYKHANGACFLVKDANLEAGRAAGFEISPSGPMFGCKMTLPEGEPRRVEDAILSAEGLSLQEFALPGGTRVEGERRPLRVPLGDPHTTAESEGLRLAFALPKGSYATALLREVMKPLQDGQAGANC
jgi:tRNA pseudouridine13 synthase